jgi:hypothetical protein
MTSGAHELT